MSDKPKCGSCGRPLPTERADAPPKRPTFSCSAPVGEKNVIPDLLQAIHQRWADKAALPPMSAGGRYYTLVMALTVILQSNLEPTEEGA